MIRRPSILSAVVSCALALAACVAHDEPTTSSAPYQGDGGTGNASGHQIGGGSHTSGGGGKGDAGVVGTMDAGSGKPGEGLIADFTPAQVISACKDRDRTEGLVGNIPRACQVEAYLVSSDPTECVDNLDACKSSGSTLLALEEPSQCSIGGVSATNCLVTAFEMHDCAAKVGAFWLSRSCDADSLLDLGPDCVEQLSLRCPDLYGTGGTGGSGTGGGGGTKGACVGTSESCFSKFSSSDCIASGCNWSSADSACTGSATPCTAHFTSASCTEVGCIWTE